MPFTTIQTTSGLSEFHYTISTPFIASANHIEEGIPTVLFLHPVYISQVIFHPQLIDRSLRRFNWVGIDARQHGLTATGPTVGYGPKVAADDVFKIMESIKLPPCHFVGLSMGATTALELAVAHPEKVLSLILLSCPSFYEPEDVHAGRAEIYQYWSESVKNPEHDSDGSLIGTAVYGAMQLMFNNETSTKIDALTRYIVPRNIINWDREHIDHLRLTTVDYFREPRSTSREELARIACPVKIVHSSDDVAYPTESSEDILTALRNAGVEASLQIAPGPHFVNYSRPDMINPIIHDFLLSVVDKPPPLPATTPPSPYDEEMNQLGWLDDGDQDDDDSRPNSPPSMNGHSR